MHHSNTAVAFTRRRCPLQSHVAIARRPWSSSLIVAVDRRHWSSPLIVAVGRLWSSPLIVTRCLSPSPVAVARCRCTLPPSLLPVTNYWKKSSKAKRTVRENYILITVTSGLFPPPLPMTGMEVWARGVVIIAHDWHGSMGKGSGLSLPYILSLCCCHPACF